MVKIEINILVLLASVAFIIGCHTPLQSQQTGIIIACPPEIAARALFFAEEYKNRETVYDWGGRDGLRAIRLDCSGLIVRCYRYAVSEVSGYLLTFENATVKTLFEDRTFKTDNPTAGDLIFMGNEDDSFPSHIALYVETKNDYIYFIDSTKKETPDSNINGVTKRYYHKTDKRFKGFGKIKILKQ